MTEEQLKQIIIEDRISLLTYIGNEMAYGLMDYLDYPINIPTFES